MTHVLFIAFCALVQAPEALGAPPDSKHPSHIRAPLETPLDGPGDYRRRVEFGGVDRSLILHIPPQYDGTTHLPVVFVFHGGTGDSDITQFCYGWDAVADREGFIVIYPDGTGIVQTWNAIHCCGRSFERNVDDIGFIRFLVEQITRLVPVDERRVFASGMSNGAMLCHRLASELSDRFAAVAPIAGTIGGNPERNKAELLIEVPPRPVPIIMFHGELDQSVKYFGGETSSPFRTTRVDVSQQACWEFWVRANGSQPIPAVETSESGNVVKRTFIDPVNRADVIHYTIRNQGHAWPGACRPTRLADRPTAEISATELAWEFFKSHPMP